MTITVKISYSSDTPVMEIDLCKDGGLSFISYFKADMLNRMSHKNIRELIIALENSINNGLKKI